MASVFLDKNTKSKTPRIDFVTLDGKRKSIRLPGVPEGRARKAADMIQDRLDAKKHGITEDPEVTAWFAKVSQAMAEKLDAAGLLHDDEIQGAAGRTSQTQLGTFLEAYSARRNDLGPSSLVVMKNVVENLVTFFGADRSMSEINAGEAKDFQRWLLTSARRRGKQTGTAGVSLVTCSKRLQWCSTFWRDAIDRKLVESDPFAKLKKSKATNPERQVYVPVAVVQDLIDNHCPNAEWRCLLALARYLGFRIPTEVFELRWANVNFATGRMRVISPKTKKIGKGSREVPILPAVRPYLEDLWHQSEGKGEFVFPLLRSRDSAKQAAKGYWAATNLRQMLERILKRAGTPKWLKIFHNLRSSAQTDLTNRLPAHVVCAWLGNTEAVAQAHYLQVTDDHFAAALAGDDAFSAAQEMVQHNPQHHPLKMRDNARHAESENEKTPYFKGFSLHQMEAGGHGFG